MSSNGNTPHDHEHNDMTEAELREHNKHELIKGINDLHIYNESRMALIPDGVERFELQFEMLSFKLDIIVDALSEILSADKEMLLLSYGLNFQVMLSKHLDRVTTINNPAPSDDAAPDLSGD